MNTTLSYLIRNDFASLDNTTQKAVYRDFYHLVYGTVIHMVKNHASAEDIVQETFLKTIYNAPNFDNEKQLISWIRVITKNYTLNILRKNKKTCIQEDMESVFNYVMHINQDESLEEKLEVNILEKNILESLSEMNKSHRQIIELKWKENMSNKDIAQKLETSESAVKQKLYRARKALKRKIVERSIMN